MKKSKAVTQGGIIDDEEGMLADFANITTDENIDRIDRRASILPGTPRRGEDEGRAPALAPTTPAAPKMTTFPSDVYSHNRIQRLVYAQCAQ